MFRLYHVNLLTTLQRLVKCRQTAEDLAQETYARVANVSTSQSITFPRAFLFRTATNLALDHLRKEKVRLHLPLEVAEALPTSSPSVELHMSHKERLGHSHCSRRTQRHRTHIGALGRRSVGYAVLDFTGTADWRDGPVSNSADRIIFDSS